MKQPRVLYADDYKDTLDLFAVYLGRRGLDVQCANSAAACLALWTCAEAGYDPSFDVVILDLKFSDGSGADLCRHIRDTNAAVPIFFYSGSAQDQDRTTAMDAGATDFFVKPLGFDDLIASVTTACGNGHKPAPKPAAPLQPLEHPRRPLSAADGDLRHRRPQTEN